MYRDVFTRLLECPRGRLAARDVVRTRAHHGVMVRWRWRRMSECSGVVDGKAGGRRVEDR